MVPIRLCSPSRGPSKSFTRENSVGPYHRYPTTFSTYSDPVQDFFLSSTPASMHTLTKDDEDALNCGSGGGADTFLGLRVASIFIISVCSTFDALFPVLVKSSSWLHVPKSVFENLCKIFWKRCHCAFLSWSPVNAPREPTTLSFVPQIATAFIHLLSPALDALSSDCLADGWRVYVSLLIFSSSPPRPDITPHQPYALALCMLSIVFIFILELIAFRWGTKKLAKIGMSHGKASFHLTSRRYTLPYLPSRRTRTRRQCR
ncbi:hypothetical protein EDD18DRAFT_737808 [Armillaria luteobubalina]|uniref:Uncharacterized protein n=1 Tax=Armillaria luteobubalina TaxID=153913 RepID=A0AA39QEK1_9AGAR|nr:hypothetical protein EDD18DRAFT_737808 [Armillaria luteobubalina]